MMHNTNPDQQQRIEKSLDVLLVTPSLALGGEEMMTFRLGYGLSQRGHRVHWVSSGGPLLSKIHEAGFAFHEEKLLATRSPFMIRKGALAIQKIIQEHDIDIIHVSQVYPALMAGLAAKRVSPRRTGVVWDAHGVSGYTYPIVGRLFPYYVDFVVAGSEAESRRLIAGNMPQKMLQVIHTGIDLASFNVTVYPAQKKQELGLDESAPTVVSVGRFTWEKGHEYLIRAIPDLLRTVPQAQVVLVGGGTLEVSLKELAARLGVLPHTVFTGFRTDIPEILTICDVFVLPSVGRQSEISEVFRRLKFDQSSDQRMNWFRSLGIIKTTLSQCLRSWEEVLPLVCLEAMAMSKPIVATHVGGVPEEVLDGETGFLVPPRDPEALASKISWLLTRREDAASMGKRGREIVEQHFTIDRLAREMENAYWRILASRDRGK